MTILDKLLEKKDLRIYLDGRIAELRNKQHKAVTSEAPEDREKVRQRFKGRIKELKRLRQITARGELKQESKRVYEEFEVQGRDE